MRVRLSKTRWLVIIVVALSAAGLLGWCILRAARARSTMTTITTMPSMNLRQPTKNPRRPVAGPGEADPGGGAAGQNRDGPVVLGPLDNRVSFTGELVFNEERLAKIRSRVPGRVVQIVADYGQMVKPGDVLAIIDSVELSQAQMGSRQAAAKFNAAQKAYDRARLLYEGKAISRAELQERQARLEVERADLDYAQNRLRLLGAGGDCARLFAERLPVRRDLRPALTHRRPGGRP